MIDYGPQFSSLGGGESVMYYRPRGYSAAARRLVLFAHGRGGDAYQCEPAGVSADPGGLYRLARELVRFGFVVASFTYLTPTNWGAQAAIDKINNTLLPFCAANLGVGTAAFACMGYSMGHVLMANYTKQNLGKVKALVGFAPATDVDHLYATVSGANTEIDAAYATWATAGGNAFDPIDSVAAMGGVRWQGWVGSGDVLTPPGDVTGGVLKYRNALAPYAATAELHEVAGDHGSLWGNIDQEAIARFVHNGGNW